MKTLTQKISIISISTFGLFLVIPSVQKWSLLILLGLAAVLVFFQEKKFQFKKLLLVNASLYLVFLFSVLFSYHPEDTLKRLVTALPILIIPIIFTIFLSGKPVLFSKKVESTFIKVLFLTSVVFSILIFVYFAYLGYFSGANNYEFCMSQLGRKMPFLNDHPIYLSIPLALSVLFSVDYFKNRTGKAVEKVIVSVLTLFLLFTICFLARKGIIIALVLSTVPMLILSLKNRRKYLIIGITAILGISVLFFFIPANKNRLIELFKAETYSQRNETNSTNNRLQIYKCAVDLIKDKPIFGFGIGRDREVLFDCYKKRLYYLYENRFNTHNQYLSITMKIGLAGLLVFLYFLFFNFKLAYQNKDWLYFCALLFFIIIMLIENILERQNGVILFTFIINFFAFKNSIPKSIRESQRLKFN